MLIRQCNGAKVFPSTDSIVMMWVSWASSLSGAPRTIIVEDGERKFDSILCRQP